MSNWIHSLHLGWMTVIVLAASYVVAAAFHVAAAMLGRSEGGRAMRGIVPVLVTPLAVTFGLLGAFTAAQVWGDVDQANASVNREASALRTVVLLAGHLPDPTPARLRELVRRHIDEARTIEWPAMAGGRATLTAVPAALAEALEVALRVDAMRPADAAAQRAIVGAISDALDARRQRIVVSHAGVNGVKWTGLVLQALLTLAAISLMHAENRAASAVALGLFSTSAAVCILLILAHDRPFTGSVSVPPTELLEVRPDSTR
jgi:Protein of unknown function (DUF4239)